MVGGTRKRGPGKFPRAFRALGAALAAALVAACAGPPAPRAAPPPRGDSVHVLRPGETVYRLSRYYEVPVEAIVRANGLVDVSDLAVGTRLRIPGARRRPPGDDLSLAAVAPGLPGGGPDTDLRFAWPLEGRLSSGFGRRGRRPHQGIDISARPGTPIRAAEAGKVIYSGWLGGYGRVVIVKHAGRYSTVYAHNRANKVRVGQFVERGDVVALVGSSGRSSGPHVHFEVRRDDRAQNPLRFLP